MKNGRILAIVCACCMMFANCISLPVFAEETTMPVAVTTDENVRATGLIMTYTLYSTAGVKKIYISATTTGYDTMAKIGFKSIKSQLSSNGSSGWTDEKNLSDQLVTDSMYHHLDQYTVSVAGGYYYRVVLTHYAKEQGWFFPSSQSITNYSNVVWVPSN